MTTTTINKVFDYRTLRLLTGANWFLSEEKIKALRITYCAEFIAMAAFGIAWFVAGKWLLFVDKEDALKLFGK